ncbi:hypothetical protein AMTR_s00136p00093430 [Amborella trichopoda]|uniref:Uncharacterized protein n=1 Tax=Amborella trichopoda TaxID=13333 RepID=W1NEZ5_AMBTC|nr:hypothetical protein AMTR_s00136p00093430 [Amborella trichopoda]
MKQPSSSWISSNKSVATVVVLLSVLLLILTVESREIATLNNHVDKVEDSMDSSATPLGRGGALTPPSPKPNENGRQAPPSS